MAVIGFSYWLQGGLPLPISTSKQAKLYTSALNQSLAISLMTSGAIQRGVPFTSPGFYKYKTKNKNYLYLEYEDTTSVLTPFGEVERDAIAAIRIAAPKSANFAVPSADTRTFPPL